VAVASAVALAATREPVGVSEFLQEVAAAAAGEDSSVAEAIESLTLWASLDPAAAARHLHESGLDGEYPGWQGISSFVVPSVCWSLYSFLRSPDDYWETICTAIAVGGDTDTMAAMAGAISGARLGLEALPRDLLVHLTDRGSWKAEALAELARSCAAVANRAAPPRG